MPELTGLYRGAVHDTNDPENRGRLRVLVPAALGNAPSAWAEPVLPTSAIVNWKVGDRVWIMFEDGDVNRPAYISRMEVGEGDISPTLMSTDFLMANDAFINALAAVNIKATQVEVGTARWNTDDGFVIPGVATFPATGTTSATLASLVANRVTVDGQFSLRGLLHELAVGGMFTLQAGTTAPTNQPVVNEDYSSFLIDSSVSNSSALSVFTDGAYIYYYTAEYSMWQMGMDGSSPTNLGTATIAFDSVTKIGGTFYGVVRFHTSQYSVYTFTWTGTTFSGPVLWQGPISPFGPGSSTTVSNLTLGTDGVDLLIGYNSSSYDRITLAGTRTHFSVPTAGSYDMTITGVPANPTTAMGFGGARVILCFSEKKNAVVYNGSMRVSSEDWITNGYAQKRFLFFTGTTLMDYATKDTRVTTYTNDAPGGNVWRAVSATWFIAGTPSQESIEGPRYIYQSNGRARTNVSYPAVMPAGVTGVRYYIGTAASQAAATALTNTGRFLLATRPDNSQFQITTPLPITGPAPSASTIILAGIPAKISASANGFSIDAKSNGSVGAGTFRDSVDARVPVVLPTKGGRAPSGSLVVAGTPVDVPVVFNIPFPVGTTPHVVATPSIVGDPSTAHVSVHTISRTGFTCRMVRSVANGDFEAEWIAFVPNSS